MFLELQQQMARQWLDLAEANLRAFNSFTADLTRETVRAVERGSDAPDALHAAAPWMWPAEWARSASRGYGWPVQPWSFAAPAAGLGWWTQPAGATAWMWPMMSASQQLGWFGPASPFMAGAATAWPHAQAAQMTDAVTSAYRSASGFAAAAMAPFSPPAPAPSRLPWPFAVWEAFIPRR